MKKFTTYSEIENLCEAMIKDFMKRKHYTNAHCVDIEAFVTEYLGIPIVYETFAEPDPGRIGFLSDGIRPLWVVRGNEKKQVLFPKNTVVLEKYLQTQTEIGRKRFTIAHEGAHFVLSKHIPAQTDAYAAFHSEFDTEMVYSPEMLREMLSINESFGNRAAACLLMPKFLVLRLLKQYNGGSKVIAYDYYVMSQEQKIIVQRMADATTHPDLALEWSERNGDLHPDMVNDKSTKSVWWKCHVCGYEWKHQIKTRVNGGECPSCSNRCAITGYNDLASTEPELMKEWDYSKNKIDPTKILRTAYNRAWWKCEFGHSWNAPICDRTLGDCSCKECESEFIASLPQLLTMYYARENNLNVVLRTTDVIGLPVDAYIPYFNLVVDGFEHSRKIKAVKKSLCNQNGITYCEINSKDPFAMAAQIKALFRKNHVYITSENENDIRFCRNLFFSVKRKNARML